MIFNVVRSMAESVAVFGVSYVVALALDRYLFDPEHYAAADDPAPVTIRCAICGAWNAVEQGELFKCWKCVVDGWPSRPASPTMPSEPAAPPTSE